MVNDCCVLGCGKTFGVKENLSFHGFPFKDEDILQKWIQATGRKNWVPSKNRKICGEHFSKEDYTSESSHRLKSTAVPSISIAVDCTNGEFIIDEQRSRLCESYIKTEDLMEVTSQQDNTQNEQRSRLCESYIKTEDLMEGTSQQDNTQGIEKGTQTTPPKRSAPTPLEVNLKKKIRTLQKTLQRRDKKISILSDSLRKLKKYIKRSPQLLEVLEESFTTEIQD